MKQYQDKHIIEKQVVTITCDRCKKVATIDSSAFFEFQEFKTISLCAGYGSVFGDGGYYEVDLCQHCLRDLLGAYLREVDPDWKVK
jgi:hypothetical protein